MTWSIDQMRRGLSPGFGGGRFDLRVELLSFFGAPSFLWVAGDGNSPTIGPALTLVGSVSEGSPIVLASGEAVATEAYAAGSYRVTGVAVDPGASDDVVIAVCAREPADFSATRAYYGTILTRGYRLYSLNGSGEVQFMVTGDSSVRPSGLARREGAPGTFLATIDRDGLITLRRDDVTATPASCPSGSIASGFKLSVGAYPSGSYPITSTIAYLAIWYGTGIANDWDAAKIADFYARFGAA